jgi:hypothetical protein
MFHKICEICVAERILSSYQGLHSTQLGVAIVNVTSTEFNYRQNLALVCYNKLIINVYVSISILA